MATVIIPAYKPDHTLITITDELWTHGCRMIVVDDGSGSEFQHIFHKIQDICIILHHSENRGKGAAIKTALSYIRDEMWDVCPIGIMDCDGQHLPEDMIRLLAYAEAHGEALVLGVRTVGKEMPLRSRLGNRITRTVFSLVSGAKVSDTQTGLRAFWPELIPRLLSVEGERYEYEMNVLMECAKAKIPVEEVPVHTIYRDQKNSSSHFRWFRDSVRIYGNIFKFTLSSLSGFVLDYVLFSLLMFVLPHTAVWALSANVAARVVSACWNYLINCRFVFRTSRKVSTALRYFALAGFILFMNSLILKIFIQIFHIHVYTAKLLTECLLFLLSWLIQNFVIFRKKQGNMKEKRLFYAKKDNKDHRVDHRAGASGSRNLGGGFFSDSESGTDRCCCSKAFARRVCTDRGRESVSG